MVLTMSSDRMLAELEFEQPLQDTREYQESEERQHWVFTAIISTLILVGGFVIFLAIYHDKLKPGLNRWIIIGINAASLAFVLACAYFFAFRFFEDLFFLFLAIGWLANAAYLPFELLFQSGCDPKLISPECFHFSLFTYGLSFVSSIAFYVASLTGHQNGSSYPVWRILGGWAGGIGAWAGGTFLLIRYGWLSADPAFDFTMYAIPGALFSAYGLFRVGLHVSRLLKPSGLAKDLTFSVLSFTFYGYAFLQLTYPFKIYLLKADVSTWFYGLFVVAIGIKVTNVYSLVKVLLQVSYPQFIETKLQLEAAQERLGRRSQLAALGAISASIEHDMKTPLSGISTKLETMRHLYPDGKIREYIEKIEADKNRIAAIAKVVPFMRGSQEFYDRDQFMNKESVNAMVNRAVASVKGELSLDPQKFFFPINPELKKSQRNIEHFVRAYAPMIEQMLVNFFKNSIEAIRETERDTGAITISVAPMRKVPDDIASKHDLKRFSKWIRVDIEDNGCGIAQEDIPKLTSLFTTKSDRKANGGIGLFIARMLVSIHEGCMEITSEGKKGAKVSVYLPEWDAYQSYSLSHPEEGDEFIFGEAVHVLEAVSEGEYKPVI